MRFRRTPQCATARRKTDGSLLDVKVQNAENKKDQSE